MVRYAPHMWHTHVSIVHSQTYQTFMMVGQPDTLLQQFHFLVLNFLLKRQETTFVEILLVMVGEWQSSTIIGSEDGAFVLTEMYKMKHDSG
jgi:hypothetical protein